MKKTYAINTLGCKVNQCESDAIAQYLEHNGWIQAAENADLCIINTCTVTHRASMQSRQSVRHTIRANPDAKILVTGCYAQTEPEAIQAIEGVHYVVGHSDKHKIPELINLSGKYPIKIWHDVRQEKIFQNMPSLAFGSRARPVLKIQDGCNSFCSYCIVPYTRGRSRSMDLEQVLENIRQLKIAGFREVILSGIHVGNYGQDLSPKTRLTHLLTCIQEQKIIDRVRISSIEPTELNGEIIKITANSDHFCKHFHIPLQSGDDGILKQMGRPYTREFFKELVLKIHKNIPEAAIGVDTLIGFPGESAAAFQNTYDLISELPVTYLHVFPYSQRPGTPAAEYPDQIEKNILKERCRLMRKLGQNKRRLFYENALGKVTDVLIENRRDMKTGLLKGVSSNYLNLLIDGKDDLKHTICKVRPEKICGENATLGIFVK